MKQLNWQIWMTVFLAIALQQAGFGQCSGFWATVDTDPPYLTYCPGDTVAAFPIITGGTGPFTYEWSTGGTDSIEILTALESGWYNVCVTITDANGCVAYGCKHIKPTFWNLYAYTSGVACEGEDVTLWISGGGTATYLWSTGETTSSIAVSTAGIYSVTVTESTYGCEQVLTLEPEFIPPPVPEIIGPTEVCDGQTATLEVANPGQYYFFSWESGATTPSIEVTGPGTYIVTVTDQNWCTGTSEIVVAPLDGILPDLQAPAQLCPENDGIVEVLNSGDFDSFLWSTGETTESIVGIAPQTYGVTVVDVNGCIESDSITIEVFDVEDPTLQGDADMCVTQETIEISIDQTYDQYEWSTGETTQTINIDDAGTYSVTVTDANGCTTTGEHTVEAAPIPEPFIQVPAPSCDSLPVLLTVYGDGAPYTEFLWSPNWETTPEIVVYSSGTFAVTVTNAYGCTGETYEEAVYVGNGPGAHIEVLTAGCDGVVTLLASGGDFYEWSTGETGEIIDVTTEGIYSVTVSDENECTEVAQVDVIITGELPIEIMGPESLCTGGSDILSASPGFSEYLWDDGQSTEDILINGPGTYSVTVTDESGCTGAASWTVEPAEYEEPQLTGDPGFCPGGDATIELVGDYTSISWSTGATGSSITVNSGGLYTVEVTSASGCTGVAEWLVEEYPEPSVEIVGPATICSGSDGVLEVVGTFTSIEWSNGATSPQISVAAAGLYTVTVIDQNGCDAAAEHTLTIGEALEPVVVVTAEPCSDSAIVDAGAGYDNYIWSNGAMGSEIVVDASGVYTVTVSDASGCSGVGSGEVTLFAPPVVDVTGPSALCSDSTGVLSASSGFDSYNWSNGSTNSTITVNESGLYIVTVVDANGCAAIDSHSYIAHALPSVEILGPASICTGTQAILSLSGSFASVSWSNGATSDTIQVAGNGTFEVVATDMNGCTATDIHLIEESDSLRPEILVTGPACEGIAVLDVGAGFDTYEWSDGSSTASVSVTASGFYQVTVTDQYGCSGAATVEILIPDAPQVEITGPARACDGESAVLAADGSFSSYAWSTGDTSATITVNASDVYTLVVTDANGCTAESSWQFEVLPEVELEIQGPTAFCSADNITLSAVGSFLEVFWNTGSSDADLTVEVAGTYSVIVTDANGCTASAEVTVEEMQSDVTTIELETCSVLDTGMVEELYVNQYGCDSVVTYHRILAPSLSTDVAMTGCPGEMLQYNGIDILAGSSHQFVYTASNGCDSIVTVAVEELPPVESEVLTKPTCLGSSDGTVSILITSGAQPCLYSLDDQDFQLAAEFAGLAGGMHQISILDGNGCVFEQLVEIPVTEPAEVIVEDQELSCDQQMALLSPEVISGDPLQINWQWFNGSTEKSIVVDEAGTYSVLMDDGCSERELTFHVVWASDMMAVDDFYVPNAFSPNRDGINETFRAFPPSDQLVRNFEFRIFDRWGNQMFHADDVDTGWDGAFKGLQMEPGVYVWYLKATVDLCGVRGFDIMQKGDVTVVR